MRFFWRLNGMRYVVRDGEEFYISEYNFGTSAAQEFWLNGPGDPVKSGLSPHTQSTAAHEAVFGMKPTETRWARYDPKAPYHITFDADKAVFEKHTFSDVQAVGFYVAKNDWADQGMAIKWYAF